MNKDIAASAVQAVPGYVATGALIGGVDLPHVVMVLTAIWTVLSIIHLIVKWNRE